MGARHNRNRTRSRPRNRTPAFSDHSRCLSLSSSGTFSSVPSMSPSPMLATHWHDQYSKWQERTRTQQLHDHHEAIAAEAQRLRIFGGEAGDEVSLCAPMLQVVMGLFNGSIDYEDP